MPGANASQEFLWLYAIVVVLGILPTSPYQWKTLKVILRSLKVTSALIFAIFSTFVLGMTFGAYLIYKHLFDKFPVIMTIITAVPAIIGAISISKDCIGYLFNLVTDYFKYKKIRRNLVLNRASVSRDFLKLRTNFFRLKFVQWLEIKSSIDSGGLMNKNDKWPNKRPQIVNDKASLILAQLDARWMGLN